MISDSCLSILDSMGINIYGVSVTFSPNDVNKAGCSPEKRQVYIGDSFFASDISAIDAVSIVAHEFIHINEDVKRYSYESQRVYILFYEMIPQEIETYIKEVVLCGPYISENEYQNYCTIKKLQEPEKYRNEVNAYEREVQLFSDVSPKYYKERRYAIWYYSLLEYFANEYYKL